MKYCDTCIHFVKQTLGCAIFGARTGKGLVGFPVEYVRAVPFKMCGPEGTYHITQEEKNKIDDDDLRANSFRNPSASQREVNLDSSSRLIAGNVNMEKYFGFEEKDYVNPGSPKVSRLNALDVNFDAHKEWERDASCDQPARRRRAKVDMKVEKILENVKKGKKKVGKK